LLTADFIANFIVSPYDRAMRFLAAILFSLSAFPGSAGEPLPVVSYYFAKPSLGNRFVFIQNVGTFSEDGAVLLVECRWAGLDAATL
jgi:hypothetical protein